MRTGLRHIAVARLAGVALLAMVPAPLLAQSAPAASNADALAARLAELEAEVRALRAEVAASRAAPAPVPAPAPQIAATTSASPPAAAAPAAAATPAEGFRVGSTSIRLGGYIKTVANFSRFDDGVVAANSLGRDFYLPQTIPVGGTSEGTLNDFSAKQTRLFMNFTTDVSGHRLGGYIEGDFQTSAGTQGTQRTSNGYNFALRRAYVTFDNLTIGQDWSTFQYVGALPETTDFVGPTEGTVFVRQPLIRYTVPLGRGLALAVSAENPETASAIPGAAALTENDDDRMPDIAARLVHSGSFGEIAVAGVLRDLSVANGTVDDTAFGWGVSAGAKLLLDGATGPDLRLMLTHGQGIGRYVGVNFAPDVIVTPGSGRLARVSTAAALAAVRVPFATGWRSTIMGGWQRVSYPDGFAATAFSSFNRQAWSLAGNIFYSPVRGLDLGVEYRHGERELVNGLSGQLDRLEFAAKYSF